MDLLKNLNYLKIKFKDNLIPSIRKWANSCCVHLT